MVIPKQHYRYLSLHVHLTDVLNASHTGALANMTLGEFGNAKYTGESYVVSVINHKTVGVRGSADIVLSPSLYKEANNYSLNFRWKALA